VQLRVRERGIRASGLKQKATIPSTSDSARSGKEESAPAV